MDTRLNNKIIFWLLPFLSLTLCPHPGQCELKYMGVASCSSSNCHGSVSPRQGSSILHNEYVTWSKDDKHSKAWQVLTDEDSKQIGMHLGINSPEKEPLCLKCHSLHLPNGYPQDKRFRVEDGVSCEACHGPAEKYLASHTQKDASHQRNVTHGMWNLTSLSSRASICLDCHYGNKDNQATHRLIGSGHPRLTFELDTFGMIQPPHWRLDQDYVERKGKYLPIKAWFEGQLERSLRSLDSVTDMYKESQGEGLLRSPELSVLYCFACHHSLDKKQSKARNYHGNPGELSINVSSLVMVAKGVSVFDVGKANTLKDYVQAFKRGNADTKSMIDMAQLLKDIKSKSADWDFSTLSAQTFINKLLSQEEFSLPLQYEDAEQLVMAVASVIASDDQLEAKYKKNLEQLYAEVESPDSYVPDNFLKSCNEFISSN